MMEQCKEKLNIAMFGQKRIPSREGGIPKPDGFMLFLCQLLWNFQGA